MTSEDFMQLAHSEGQAMSEYERKYTDIQGSSFENEIAKIMMRYANEGKPESQISEDKKKVRWESEEQEQSALAQWTAIWTILIELDIKLKFYSQIKIPFFIYTF